jgi:hypothetical protein
MTEDRKKQRSTEEALPDEAQEPKLMESGNIRPDGDDRGECRVSRGMPAISMDGQEVGWVAAIELDTAGKPTGVVMARTRITLEYYHLPLGLISRVNHGRLLLQVEAEVARSLPRRVIPTKVKAFKP